MAGDPAMLTPAQRKYLVGETEYESQQAEDNARYKIRSRVRESIFDFIILAEEMEPRDREQLLKDVRPPSVRDDDDLLDEEAYREDESGALVHALGFLFRVAEDVGYDLELVVERALVAMEGYDPGNPFDVRAVDVSIDRSLGHDVDRTFERIEAGKALATEDLLGIKRLVVSDLSEFVRRTTSADVDVVGKLERGEELSPGESLVLVGRVIDEPALAAEYDVMELIDEDVKTELGLGNELFT